MINKSLSCIHAFDIFSRYEADVDKDEFRFILQNIVSVSDKNCRNSIYYFLNEILRNVISPWFIGSKKHVYCVD